MGFLICAVCLFTFPKPDAFDVDEVRRLVERTYSAKSRPWSEVAGPYARVELHLITADFGFAEATLTWVGTGISPPIVSPGTIVDLSTPARQVVRVAVRRVGGEWEIVTPN